MRPNSLLGSLPGAYASLAQSRDRSLARSLWRFEGWAPALCTAAAVIPAIPAAL